jgi:HD-GYP domain-containing protein (c-di-GMP phosphodiesterase class II)
MENQQPRLAELVGSLSLATDVAAGLALETALRTSLLAVQLGRELNLRGQALADVYYTGLLRFIGCTAFAHETAKYGAGDDQGLLRTLTPVDTGRPIGVVGRIIGGAGQGAPPLRRAGAVLRLLLDPKMGPRMAAAHCSQAVALATRLSMPQTVVTSLGQIYERFDGKGSPHALRGDAIALPARILHVAWRAEVHRGLENAAASVAVVRERSGGELDPDLAEVFLKHGTDLLENDADTSVWESFLAAEPLPVNRIPPAQIADVAQAFAHFVDLKSPFTLNHSTGVAQLAEEAGSAAGASVAECEQLRIAALLHDLGRTSVPNGIWDKPGRLNPVEWERVRMHAYQTERVLSQSPILRPFAQIAGMHHERIDGSGYHRGIGGSNVSRLARILSASDAYAAMTEVRAHRPAHTASDAARLLATEAQEGRLDREAVEAVLTVAGHRAESRVRGSRPASLTDREVEVLCLLARGASNKAIAAELTISARTVQHHVEHIYEKTGVRTRAAAALYAVENDLLQKWAK